MSSRKWVSFLRCLTPILLLTAACSDGERERGDTWTGVCIDADGDGHGLQCAAGSDCDDSDPAIQVGCGQCDQPNEGCACADGTSPRDCAVSPEVTSEGALICKEGTRYCRDGAWSACEGISSYTAPPPSRIGSKLQGLVQGEAGRCSACNPDCYEVEDELQPVGFDGGSGEGGVTYGSGGGITLPGSGGGDAGTNPDDLTPVPPCNPVIDADCDGIPDSLDPYDGEPPFESDFSTIVMDIPPGQSKSNTFQLNFFLRTADIYFLLDMTGSMGEEKSNLIAALKSGSFLDDPSTATNEAAINCSDRNFDGVPDNSLKTAGIAGNIACLIRDSSFGAGWYRELPFSATDASGIRYSYPNFEPYEHRLDITSSVDALGSALDLFVVRSNRNWAEAAGPALYAVATGGPLYMGWDRPGVPPRTCANGGVGYPCFRPSAVPIVVLITDAPLMNGPNTAAGNLGIDSNSNKTQPVNYDATGLGHMSKSSDGLYHPVSGNETFTGTTNGAYDVGTIDNTFLTYTGNTRGMSSDITTGNLGFTCSDWPTAAYPDAVFKFTVASNKTLTVSTRGSHFEPILAIRPVSATLTTVAATSSSAAPGTAQNLGSLGSTVNLRITGDTDASAFNTGDLSTTAVSECVRGASTSATAPDAWFRFTVPSDLNNVSFSVDGGDFDAVLGLWSSPPTPPVAVTTAGLGTNDKFNTAAAALPTGTAATPGAIDSRSVWLSGGSTTASGFNADYGSSLFSGVASSCAGASGTVKDAVVDFRVTGGPKTVRIETTSATDQLGAASFDHVVGLFARPSSGSTLPTATACDRNGAGSKRALVERTLNNGTYSVVVRGESAGNWWSDPDQGTYGLLISDASTRPLACTLESSSSSFTANLKAGVTYYLGMRGRNTNNGGGRGPYSITINNQPTMCAFDNTTYAGGNYSNDDDYTLGAAEITRTFGPGTYYAVIKGKADITTVPSSDTARGMYQITFGDPTLATNELSASVNTWGTSTTGIRKALNDKGIRVITVASVNTATCGGSTCSGGGSSANAALVEQGGLLGKDTGATGTDGNGLVFKIANDGSGMGYAVVNAINRLAKNLSMNVSVRFVPLPETPSKPFIFKSRAVTTAGSGCGGTSDTDNDGIPDTHLACAPGAVPRFQVTFTNPAAPNNVPRNPATGSNGGYNMKLELVGDGTNLLGEVPVFIVPEDLPTGDEFKYDSQGLYAQDVSSACTGTDRPNWQSLAWNASLPTGTAIEWRVCTGDTTTELNACESGAQWSVAARVTPGVACASSSDCANGYCSSGTCHDPVAPNSSCTSDTDCGTSGFCSAGKCGWRANPISLLPTLLGGRNSKAKLRLQVKLLANEARTAAPAVQDFRVIYVCTPGV